MSDLAKTLAAFGGVETARAEIPEGLRLDYELRPTPVSLIRCQVILPQSERWTGRLWGQGNGGSAGGAAVAMPAFARVGDAVAHTDLGTSDDRAYGCPEVWEDFAHRATHLMTLSAKAIAEAYYGLPFGARLSVWLGKGYADTESWLWNWIAGEHRPLLSLTDDELERWASGPAAQFNALNPDLSRFAARGGKLLVTAGLEDDICEPTAHIAYAEAAAKAAGGTEKLLDFFHLYLNPGRAHGAGHHQGVCDMADMWSALVDWREKGIAPDVMQGVYDWSEAGFPDRVYGGPAKGPKGYPIAPWPDKMAGSEAAGWRRIPGGLRGGVPQVDPPYGDFERENMP